MALIAMEFLTPHRVLRGEFVGARRYPRVGAHLGLFLARTLFNTSELRLSVLARRLLLERRQCRGILQPIALARAIAATRECE